MTGEDTVDRARRRILEEDSPLSTAQARSMLAELGLPLITDDPLVDGGVRALFVWIEDDGAEPPAEVHLWANRLTDGRRSSRSALQRRPRSPLWFTELAVPADIVVTYRMLPRWDSGDARPTHPRDILRAALSDPYNAHAGDDFPFGSVATGPNAPSLRPWRQPPVRTAVVDSACTTIDGVEVAHRLIAPPRTATAPASPEVDLLVVFDAEKWVDRHRLPDVLAAANSGRTSYILAIDSPADPHERLRLLGANERVLDHLAHSLLPRARRTATATHGTPPRVRALGQSLGGLSAMVLACRHPDLIDDVLAYSPSVWWRPGLEGRPADVSARQPWIHHQIASAPPGRFTLSLAVGRYEDAFGSTVDDLAATARETGHATSFTVFSGGHDDAAWACLLLNDLSAAPH